MSIQTIAVSYKILKIIFCKQPDTVYNAEDRYESQITKTCN